jgi:SGNH hydrolase-like domain, acetyltransferase AlgX
MTRPVSSPLSPWSWRQVWSKGGRLERRWSKRQVQLLESHARIVRDGKVTYGRDGWLFLAGDSSGSFPQHTGERFLSQSDLERWVLLLDRRAKFLASHGYEHLLMIAPDTHSIYPEKLPPGTRHAPVRPVHQLMGALREAGSPARVLYPLEKMIAAKRVRLVCSKMDSHWTDFGAFVAYSALLDELGGEIDSRRLRQEEVAYKEMITAGDLSSKLTPARFDYQPIAIVRYPEARLLFDNCVENTGSILVTVCPEAPPTTCLVLGDSYANSLLKFLAESFGRVVLAHSASLDRRLVEAVQPDLVVSLMAERFLIQVPDDDDPGLAAHEQEKRQQHRTRPPFVYWAAARGWASLRQVERLRAYFLEDGRLADATIVSVLAYGGLLPRELTHLRWSEVGERELRIRRRGDHRRRGARFLRTISMIEPLADDLREWRCASGGPPGGSHVFLGRNSRYIADGEWAWWSREVFEPAVRACGLEIERPHDLRQTLCTLLLHEGRSARAVARQVGERTGVIRELYGSFLAGGVPTWEPIEAGRLVNAVRAGSPEPREVAVPVFEPEPV